jgi:putative FmdB family regulatory protein
MPIYEYQCNACHFRFEQKQKFHDKPIAKCPKCGGEARRVIHPAPVIFKGKGFYSTDSRKHIPEKKPPEEGKPK